MSYDYKKIIKKIMLFIVLFFSFGLLNNVYSADTNLGLLPVDSFAIGCYNDNCYYVKNNYSGNYSVINSQGSVIFTYNNPYVALNKDTTTTINFNNGLFYIGDKLNYTGPMANSYFYAVLFSVTTGQAIYEVGSNGGYGTNENSGKIFFYNSIIFFTNINGSVIYGYDVENPTNVININGYSNYLSNDNNAFYLGVKRKVVYIDGVYYFYNDQADTNDLLACTTNINLDFFTCGTFAVDQNIVIGNRNKKIINSTDFFWSVGLNTFVYNSNTELLELALNKYSYDYKNGQLLYLDDVSPYSYNQYGELNHYYFVNNGVNYLSYIDNSNFLHLVDNYTIIGIDYVLDNGGGGSSSGGGGSIGGITGDVDSIFNIDRNGDGDISILEGTLALFTIGQNVIKEVGGFIDLLKSLIEPLFNIGDTATSTGFSFFIPSAEASFSIANTLDNIDASDSGLMKFTNSLKWLLYLIVFFIILALIFG